jgi:hypothetical protein
MGKLFERIEEDKKSRAESDRRRKELEQIEREMHKESQEHLYQLGASALLVIICLIGGSIAWLFERRQKSVSNSPTPTDNNPLATQDNNPLATQDEGWYWWWPFEPYWWPLAYPLNETVSAFVKLYAVLGYSPCVDGSLELGYEKIALYTIGPAVKHVALQLPDGKWTSKLGKDSEKIEHTLDGLAGHGTPVQFLRRVHADA